MNQHRYVKSHVLKLQVIPKSGRVQQQGSGGTGAARAQCESISRVRMRLKPAYPKPIAQLALH